jgi:hypothetical protein
LQNIAARICVPNDFIEASQTTVQMVRSVIRGEFVFDAIQREFPTRDAVRVSSNQRAEIPRTIHVSFERFMAEHNIGKLPISIRHLNRDDNSAVVCYFYFHALVIREREDLHLFACRQYSESLAQHFHFFNLARRT